MRKTVKILGVKFDTITEKEAVKKVSDWLSPGFKLFSHHFIVTPNPEILLAAQKDEEYRKILNKADLNIADGTGILWASKFKDLSSIFDSGFKRFSKWLGSLLMIPLSKSFIRTVIPERITGVDFMKKICKIAEQKNLKIFLLGAQEGVAEITAKKLTKKFPKLEIVGTYAGSPKEEDRKMILDILNLSKPDILFVAYGAPAQEKWIYQNYKKIKSLKLAMGVGGAFDFISGIKKRAPETMQKLGIEWLYRLYKQPSRMKRIINATTVFPIKVFKD
jgi:N-acetylglucosaminyldiphosphoundecaprenol N-acetyl-beta-D-mannosaminyltransferase